MAGRGRGRGKGGRGGISYVQTEEPKFISDFKKRIGYKEGPTVDTKRQELDRDDDCDDDDNAPEREDEKPVVVVLKSGDLTETEAVHEKAALELKPANVDDIEAADGKVKFKKPTKRAADSDSSEQDSSSKKRDTKKEKMKSSAKQVKNSTLLSFGDEEEEEDD